MEGLQLAFDGPVATLTFDRQAKRNAIDVSTWRALPELLGKATARRETRVVVLQGAGGNFAAGADIGEFDEVFADPAASLAYLDDMSRATAAIEAAPLPVLAFIDGLCIGAGVAVALACDIRIATSAARFAITPAKLGLMYSLADTKRVVDAIGASTARDLLFTGRTIDAAQALAVRLVDEIAETIDVKVAQIAATSGWTHARTKAVVRRLLEGATAEDDETRSWFADAPQGADYAEGLAAFRARRAPRFPPR